MPKARIHHPLRPRRTTHECLAYGEEFTDPDFNTNRMKFTGHERDPETGLDYMKARYYAAGFGRMLQVDPIDDYDFTDPMSFNKYSYVRGNPVKATDPTGMAIYLQTHEVAGGHLHCSILIVPENQGKYKGDARFSNEKTDKDGNKQVYATLGAGPIPALGPNAKLVGEPNRKNDVDLSTKVETLEIDLGGRDEDAVIEELFQANENYDSDLDYDLFPAPDSMNYNPIVADDGQNSNSYVSGILGAVELPVPTPSGSVPGFDRPVPPAEFIDHSNSPSGATGVQQSPQQSQDQDDNQV